MPSGVECDREFCLTHPAFVVDVAVIVAVVDVSVLFVDVAVPVAVAGFNADACLLPMECNCELIETK